MSWKKVKIGDFLTRIKEPVRINDQDNYALVTIRMYHKGVIKRADVKGDFIKSSTLYSIKGNQFILSGIDARNGAFGIVPQELHGAVITNDFWTHEINSKVISLDYFYWFTTTPQFYDACIRASEGTTNRQRLQADKFYSFDVWLPSIPEQKEWVKKITELHNRIGVLNKELSNQQTYLQQLRQSILQEAVQGKLTQQNPTDEPASKLLERIKAEKQKLIASGKLKKEKELPPITEDEIPFELPDDWVWCRLGEIITVMDSGWSPACHEYPAEKEKWGVLKTTSVQEMYFLQNENKELPNSLTPKTQYEVNVGDILITRAGPFNRVGICCLVKEVRSKLIISDKIIRFHLVDKLLDQELITLCLNAGESKNFIESKKSGMAASQVNISQDNLKLTPIPLPPLSEQQRIVAKVQRLMQMANRLEQQVQQSQIQAQQLLQTVLKEAFSSNAKVYEENELITMAAEE